LRLTRPTRAGAPEYAPAPAGTTSGGTMRRGGRGLRALVGTVLVLGAGCFWTVPGQGPDRQAHNGAETVITTGTVGDLALDWEAPLDEGPAGDPVTSSAGVHVTGLRSAYGLDRTTGTRRWEWEAGADDVADQAYVASGRLHVGVVGAASSIRPTGSTVDLDPATGDVLADPSSGRVAAVRKERVVYFGSVRHFTLPVFLEFLTVRDTTTGDALCCPGLFGSGTFSPTVEPFTLSPTAVLHSGPGILDDVPPGDPGGSGNGVRAYALDTPAACTNLPTYLCPTWATALPGTTATAPVLSSDGATAYVGTDAGTLHAVDAATGAERWSASLGSAVTDAPALAQGTLLVPTAAGGLVALDAAGCGAATCPSLWSAATGSEITQQPAAAGGVVFTGSADGTLDAFAVAGCGAATCPSLWSAATGSEITGAPAVSQGRVYVGTADGRVLAYAPA